MPALPVYHLSLIHISVKKEISKLSGPSFLFQSGNVRKERNGINGLEDSYKESPHITAGFCDPAAVFPTIRILLALCFGVRGLELCGSDRKTAGSPVKMEAFSDTVEIPADIKNRKNRFGAKGSSVSFELSCD